MVPGTVELRLGKPEDASSFGITTLPNMYQLKNGKEGVVILVDGNENRAIRQSGWVMWAHRFATNNSDFVWDIDGDFTTGAPVTIYNDYPTNREKGTQVGVKAIDQKRVNILNPGDTNIKRWVFESVSAPTSSSLAPTVTIKSHCRDTSEDGLPSRLVKRNNIQYKGFTVYPRENVFNAGSCYHILQGVKDGETYIKVLRIDPGRHDNKDVITYLPVHPSVHPLLKSHTPMTVSPATGCLGTPAFTV